LTRFNTLFLIPLLAAAQPLPPGRGRDTVARVCTHCHAAGVFTSQQHTREEWLDIVHEMQNAGAKASKAEFRQIVDYLARTFPKR